MIDFNGIVDNYESKGIKLVSKVKDDETDIPLAIVRMVTKKYSYVKVSCDDIVSSAAYILITNKPHTWGDFKNQLCKDVERLYVKRLETTTREIEGMTEMDETLYQKRNIRHKSLMELLEEHELIENIKTTIKSTNLLWYEIIELYLDGNNNVEIAKVLSSIQVYKDVASSFGNRDNLNRLIDAIIEGRVSKIYCEYLDRLSRVPALTRLIEHLCEKFNVEIIAIDIESCDDKDISQKELLGFLTVWCNRVNAQKSRKVTLKELEPQTVTKIIELRKKGLTVRAIQEELEILDHRTSKGDFVSYAKCRQVCDSNGNETILTKFLANGEVENSIKEFAQTKIVKSEKGRISTNGIYSIYQKFCEGREVLAQPQNIFGKSLVKLLGKQNVRSQGVSYWKGYGLN